MTNLSDVTIIIPSYNRQRYAKRVMEYWSGRGPQVHLFDGSNDALEEVYFDGLENNITYHHAPIPLLERFKLSGEVVNTKYTLMSGDDEFFIPSAIEACIRELEVDNSLVACIGRALAFKVSQENIVGESIYANMENYEILNDDPMERIIFHMSPYVCTTFYAIVPTAVWKNALAGLVERPFPIKSIEELQFEIMFCLYGKSKVIPHLMWLRSFEQEPIISIDPPKDTDPPREPEFLFKDWWAHPEKKTEREEYLTFFSKLLLQQKVITDYQYIYDGLHRAFDGYVKDRTTLNQYIFKVKSVIIHLLAPLLPHFVKKVLRPRMEKHVPEFSLQEAGNVLKQSGCSVNIIELAEIESIITQFHDQNDK